MAQTGQATEKIPNKRPRIDALLKSLSLPEDQRKMLHGVLTDMNEEMRHIYRIIPSPVESRTGTGLAVSGGTGQAQEMVLGQILFQVDAAMACPTQRVSYDALNRKNQRYILATKWNAEITEFRGTVEVEDMAGGSPYKFWIVCPFFSGNARVPANTLVSFAVGFLRFDHPKFFFIDTQIFLTETTNPISGSQIVNEIPVTGLGGRYLTQSAILNDALLTSYNTLTGGAGLKFHMNLYIYGRRI